MRAPRDRTAARRARPGPLLGAATAIAAVVGLVLGAAGGTHALWNDQITADLGIIQVGPGTPTPPAPPTPSDMTCGGGQQNVYLEFASPDWAVGYTLFDGWVGDWLYAEGDLNSYSRVLQIRNGMWQILNINPGINEHLPTVVLITPRGDPDTVIARATVWFYRTGPADHEVFVSCIAPLTEPQSSTEGS